LIVEGIERLRAHGCPLIVVLGHPEYYPRFGNYGRDGRMMVLIVKDERSHEASATRMFW
jgi:predicted N-acetyltransferase YhbS